MKRAKPVDPMLERAERFGRGTSIEMTFAESLARFARKEVARALRAKYSKACTHHPLVHAADGSGCALCACKRRGEKCGTKENRRG